MKRVANEVKRGNAPVIVVGILALAATGILLLFKQAAKGDPVTVTQQRFVLADIADIGRMSQLISEVSEQSVVTMRDDPEGNFLFLKVLLRQDYLHDMGRETGVWNSIKATDFQLTNGTETWKPFLLHSGYSDSKSGVERLVLPGAALYRDSNGNISLEEHAAFEGEKDIDTGDLGAQVGAIKAMQSMSTFGGLLRTTAYDWVRAPLEERVSIIQPPQLKENVWQALKSYEVEDAWVGVETVLLFPLPPPGTKDVRFIFASDTENAVPINVR